jgi:cytochrome P450
MTLYELAAHQDVQHRLREELLQFEGEPTYEDLMVSNQLPYLDAVVKESIRCHPTGGTTDRVATKDDVIPLGQPIELPSGEMLDQIRIKAGQLIQIPMRAINIWEDGAEFDPERWLRKESLPGKVGGWSNISSFSEGPRMCIGYKLAILEIKIIIFTLIKAFVFYESGERIETRISTTYQTRVAGKEEEGAQLPMRVALYSEKCC